MFFDDALTASRELDLTLTGRAGGNKEKVPMCGVPFHSADTYIERLVHKGYKVAICEQMEDPKLAKGLVKRKIIKVITPGTITLENAVASKKNNYIGCTPGFSAVDLEKFQTILKDELADCFREMHDYEGKCRFRGCSHTKEAGCAVLQAVKDGEISQSRHQSYLNLYEQAKNIKEWELDR